ncbi:MAG: SDR family oxidoreductase [Candidatus Aenigmarchaeota archaeon]|nr:SDR family oxidoreductase [Candidatus Aenigmarchaeota archaeon]
MKRVLVTGAGGLLGSYIMRQASAQKGLEAVGTTRTGQGGLKMDLTSNGDISSVMSSVSPDIVINTASLTNVDYCEGHRREALAINAEGPRIIADECKKLGAKLIQISTDYVFDGKRGMYTEADSPGPVNYYGKTKLEAEKAVEQSGTGYLIVRPAIIYGWGTTGPLTTSPTITSPVGTTSAAGVRRPNYVTWLIETVSSGQKARIFDQYNSPTFAGSLAEGLLKALGSEGLYHLAGPERISRYDFALRVADKFNLAKGLIAPARDNTFAKAARPHDSSLDVSKAWKDLGIRLLTVDEGLKMMKKEFDERKK